MPNRIGELDGIPSRRRQTPAPRQAECSDPGNDRLERCAPFQPLSKREIDQHIQRVMCEVAAGGADLGPVAPGCPTTRLRWISARELIDRVRPFLILN